ncbi:MAG: hypothetical protein LBJ92_02075 [Holosporales bacterium]|jgi:hypothetical protein|nr:hypothetical protein [Holosporales bacterium]
MNISKGLIIAAVLSSFLIPTEGVAACQYCVYNQVPAISPKDLIAKDLIAQVSVGEVVFGQVAASIDLFARIGDHDYQVYPQAPVGKGAVVAIIGENGKNFGFLNDLGEACLMLSHDQKVLPLIASTANANYTEAAKELLNAPSMSVVTSGCRTTDLKTACVYGGAAILTTGIIGYLAWNLLQRSNPPQPSHKRGPMGGDCHSQQDHENWG